MLLADPNENRAEARIAIAKAAGIISEDVALAEDMLRQHRATKARTRGKAGSGKSRKIAARTVAANAADKGRPTAKPAAKKPSKKS